MSSAMNHRWRKVLNAPAPQFHVWGDGTTAGWHDHECTWMKCHGKQIVGQIAYDYVTGRQGRITDKRQAVCQEHLDKFIKKNPTAKESPAVEYTVDRHKYF